VINGFAVPLKAAHVSTLLSRVLLPLHKVSHLSLIQPQLSYCVMQFLDKEPALGDLVLRALLRYWPRQNSKKELLLMAEMEEAMERLPQLAPRPTTAGGRAAVLTEAAVSPVATLLLIVTACFVLSVAAAPRCQASPLLSIFLRSRLSLCCDSSRALGCP